MNRRWPDLDDYIDKAFGLEHVSRLKSLTNRYTRRAASNALSSGRPAAFSGETFIEGLFRKISQELAGASGNRVMESSWKWRTEPEWKERTESPEVKLERCLSRAIGIDKLTYQMAVVAEPGASKGSANNRRAIDLVQDHSEGVYEFIELKMSREGEGTQHPLAAAIELLIYAAFYCHFRLAIENSAIRVGDGPRVFSARRIDLTVLGPDWLYNKAAHVNGERLALSWLERDLNEGVSRTAHAKKFKERFDMSFRFQRFSPGFEWPSRNCLPEKALKEAWENRLPVSW